MSSKRIVDAIPRDLYVLEDESNPRGSSVSNILPSTILDQVYDDQSPTKKTLRQIIEDLRFEILTGGRGNIEFPVVSVNGKTGDVILQKNDVGLGRVDNTSDIDKPLSVPQRSAIMDILSEYDFNVNLQELYDHIMNMNNPHNVTIDQLNTGDELINFIQYYISLHNYSTHTNTHIDIRRSLMKLWTRVDDLDNGLEDRISAVLKCIDEHIDDENAHAGIFNSKENTSNKTTSFSNTSNSDHTRYPSTKAVVDYVTNRLSTFRDELPNVQNWIDDIQTVNTRDELPNPNSKYYRKAYFIRYGNDSHNEIAICRANENGTFSWDISNIGSYSRFNDNEFIDTPDGLSIKMSSIVDAILSTNGALDTSLSEILQEYYNKKDIDSMGYINNITIIPGTMDGTIRYYVNNDMETMSEDIKVSGLKRLAYLEYVTENEIWDNAIHSNHVIDAAIESRHLKDKTITPDKLSCRYGYLIGNTAYPDNNKTHEIKLTELADVLRPLIGGWPDPSTPGGNPYYDVISDMIMHPHRMITGVEYDLGDKSYCQRFTGEISCIPNMDLKTVLTNEINIPNGYRLIDAGGTWQYQTDPEEWTILGGTNYTGHTYAMVTIRKDGLFLESISIGDRMNAPYDIWVKYAKLSELEDAKPINEQAGD